MAALVFFSIFKIIINRSRIRSAGVIQRDFINFMNSRFYDGP